MKNRTLYWAYGSNLNVAAMKRRCPKAKKFEALTVEDGALVFRGVADVVVRKGSQVKGGLWWITKECEANLDMYEGVAGGLYLKRYLLLKVKGKEQRALYYVMRTDRGVMPPNEHYLETIAQGYRDFGLDLAYLDVALHESWRDKKVTPLLRERHDRKHRPSLARSVPEKRSLYEYNHDNKREVQKFIKTARQQWQNAMTIHSDD
jgi:gamma-glutamylcyclotransferase (GGCT)/AIG2-like uncharacterized protein YtfP